MSLGSVLRFFLPQDDKFLPYFEQSADNLKEAAALYASLAKHELAEDLAAPEMRSRNSSMSATS